MDAEQNKEVPEAVVETQEDEMQQENKSEPEVEQVAPAPSEPEAAPETEVQETKEVAESDQSVAKPLEPEAAPERPLSPEKPTSPEKPASPEEPKSPEMPESPEKPASPEKPVEAPAVESSEKPQDEPQIQVNSEAEKQEEEAVKEPKKEETKTSEGTEAKPAEQDKEEEAKTKELQLQPEADGVKAEVEKEAEMPLFFGWFLLPEDEERIKCATMDFLKTLDTLEAFKEHISEFTGEAEKEVDLEQYFVTSLPLHCTTKFCDYGKVEGAKGYSELQVVKESFGKSDELSVTALIVTPRTFGARVALTESQMKLWPEGADKEGVPEVLLPKAEALPAGSRAHVTLGHSANVEAVQTGLDLLEITALQKEGTEGPQVEMEMGTLTYLGEGRWILALREPITADTTFSSFSDDKPANDQGKKDGEKKKKKCTIL